jgi:hypothetical protein
MGIGVSVPCGTALSEATPQARARLQGHWQAQARQGSGHFKWRNGQVGSMGGEGSVGSIWHEYLATSIWLSSKNPARAFQSRLSTMGSTFISWSFHVTTSPFQALAASFCV